MASDEGRRRRQRAGFSIFLDQYHDERGELRWETRLYHAETGAEITFAGASPGEWIGWILGRLGSDGPIGDGLAKHPPLGVKVVEVFVTELAGQHGDPLTNLSAAMVLQLSGLSQIEQAVGAEVLRGVLNAQVRRVTDD